MRVGRLFTVVAAATLLSCSGDSSPSQPDGGGDAGLTIGVRNNIFDPSALQVPVNSTVIWQWSSGGVEHNVTFQTGANSGNQASGSFSRSFPSTGSFPYVCTIHGGEGMSGVVNVTTSTGGGGGGGDGGDGGGGYGP